MSFKPVTRSEVDVTVTAEPEWTPVRGNAMASGDDAIDKAVEDAILQRLEQGDTWAWAAVTVTVAWAGISASAYLGCCSYADEADFRQPGGYFDDLVDESLTSLNEELERLQLCLCTREA